MSHTTVSVSDKVRQVLVDALGVDEDEIIPTTTLVDDLGAESIDWLDITFRLEKVFDIKIPRGELFPDSSYWNNLQTDPRYVADGYVLPDGVDIIRAHYPHIDFGGKRLDVRESSVEKEVLRAMTVVDVERYIIRRLAETK